MKSNKSGVKFFVNLLLFVALPFNLSAGEVNQNNDRQIWLYESTSKQITEKTKITLEGELRYGDDCSTLFLRYLQSRLLYSPCKWLELAPGYRQQAVLRVSDRTWISVYNPLIDISGNFDLGKWQAIDRNRIQYLIIKSIPNLWQYRNRITLISPWKLGTMKLNPLISEEVFFRETVGFSENRFSVGGAFSLGKRTKTSLLYLLRHQKRLETWKRHHVCYALINFSF